jgi:ABC-type uncharacterized transport system involved in gliding motility auxiliary subunit
MNKQTLSTTGLVLAAALLLAVVLLSNTLLAGVRLDLTATRLYTLSDGTRRVLGGIEEPINLKLYYSNKLFADVPQIATYGERVRDLLREYVRTAGGKLRLTLVDPEPYSETEDQAVAAGIQQLPVGESGEMGYFGLVGSNSTDDEAVIPVFQPSGESSLEYELSRLVHGLAHPVKRRIGVLSWLPQFGNSGQSALLAILRETFDVTFLPLDSKTIGKDIDTLVVIHPKDPKKQTLYAIDQFLMRGGKAMVFVDPLSEEDPVQPDPNNPIMLPSRDSSLPDFFARWGLDFDKTKIVTDVTHAIRVQYAGGRGAQEIEFLPWLGIEMEGLSQDDFTTNQLNRVHLGNAGALVIKPEAAGYIKPLISTGPQSMLLESDAVIFQRDPAKLLGLYKPEAVKRAIAVRILGPLKSAFPEGRPKVESQMDADPDFKAESSGPVNVVVVADTDILADRFWVRFQNSQGGGSVPTPIADNANFFINVLDQMGGSEDLISLRSRAVYARPFLRVDAIRREAEARFRDEAKALEARLAETENRIMALQSQPEDGSGKVLLSPEQKLELDRFRDEQLRTRRELRNVQRELQRNIESLGNWLKFINIGLVPLFIAALAVLTALSRSLARRRARV